MDGTIYKDFLYYYNLITTILFTTISFIFNPIVFLILTKPDFRKQSLFRYQVVGTVTDSLNIIMIWANFYPNFFKINESETNCKFISYITQVLTQLSLWINVVSSIDRLLAVNFINFKIRNELKFQALVLITLFFVILLLNFPILHFNQISAISYEFNNTDIIEFNISSSALSANKVSVNTQEIDVILYSCNIDQNAHAYISYLLALMSTFIPFTLMIGTTGLIFYQLKVNKRKINQNISDRDKKFVKNLLGLNLFYFICYTPSVIYNILNFLYTPSYMNASEYIFIFVYYNLISCLIYIYMLCNFFVFFLSNKLFKKRFLLMIGCKA
jgi:hypothetical protein